MITRTVLPVVYQPALLPGGESDFGLGDTTFTAFFSPAKAAGTVWGVGPVALLPTSTGDTLGAGEWGAGLSAVVLAMPKPWVVGALVSNVWSFDGGVNLGLLQPFVNYNLAHGWYLTSAPIWTADWQAPASERWTIPMGGGAGKIFSLGQQPMNASLQYFYNVEHPSIGPEWSIRFQLQLLFPK